MTWDWQCHGSSHLPDGEEQAAALRVLIWQWGRRGGGPRYAVELANGLMAEPSTQVALSLSTGAELLREPDAPHCDLPVRTYDGLAGLFARVLQAPRLMRRLTESIRSLRPDMAICAMPGPLDLLMATALRRADVPFLAVIHDADAHPGDFYPLQIRLQRALARRCDGLIVLSRHVADRLRAQGVVGRRTLMVSAHPVRKVGVPPPWPLEHGGTPRVLCFGRLLPYKGLDLLADAWDLLGPEPGLELRAVGSGPGSAILSKLQALPGVTVENRWVPETEIPALIGWADALVLSHREASQSGGAAIAIPARRWVVATRVGGLVEQLAGEPMAIMCEPDAESLAAALRRFRDDRPPQTMDVQLPNPFTTLRGQLEQFRRATLIGLTTG